MHVRITHIDGKLPNLALMRLSAYHKGRGDTVYFSKSVTRALDEPEYDRVYGSAIFTKSAKRVKELRRQFPGAVVGGTGTTSTRPIESFIGDPCKAVDYSIYPDFRPSLGFTQRGCRLKCSFCVVPEKEGAVKAVGSLASVWRGERHDRNLVLLDNDFFGNPQWHEIVAEARGEGFTVCLTQGVNLRLFSRRTAQGVADLRPRDTQFKRQHLYAAWDGVEDEAKFFRGVRHLEDAGFPATRITAYVLMGHAPGETDAEIMYRIDKLRVSGIRPYPMPYDAGDPVRYAHLKRIQRWVNTGTYKTKPFSEYSTRRAIPDKTAPLLDFVA